MKKISLLLTVAISILFTSCGNSKQYSSCGDLASSLKGSSYNSLVEEWGQPIKKESRGGDWYVIWPGVGFNGHNQEIMFKSSFVNYSDEPGMYEGVSCN